MTANRLLCLGAALILLAGCPAEDAKKKKRSSGSSSSSSSDEPINPLGADTWEGTYRSAKLTLVLKKDGDDYTGQIEMPGKGTFPLKAKLDEGIIEGTFESGGNEFSFKVERESDQVKLSTGGTTYALAPDAKPKAQNPLAGGKTGGNPLAGGGGDTGGTGGGTPSAAPGDWKAFSARGFSLKHPSDWRVQTVSAEGGLLIPGDVRMANGKPAEAYLVQSVSARGAKQASAPQSIAFLKSEAKKGLFRIMQEDGQPEPLGDDVLLKYTGKNPQDGKPFKGRLYARIIDGFAFLLIALAQAEDVDKRADTLTQIFKTFAFKRPPNDPRLIGHWRNTRSYSSGGFSHVSDRYLWLRADGVCFSGSKSMASMSHRGPGGRYRGSSSLDDGKQGGYESKGRWVGINRKLVLNWNTGKVEAYGYYYVQGNDMMLKWNSRKDKKAILYKRTGR